MFIIYARDYNYISKSASYSKLIDKDLKNVYTTAYLDKGQQTLNFALPATDEYIPYIENENVIETDDYLYRIKEISCNNHKYINALCYADIDSLKFSFINTHSSYNQVALKSFCETTFSRNPWQAIYQSKYNTTITYQQDYLTVYEMLLEICNKYGFEYWFDTKERKIYITDTLGSKKDTIFMNDLRLKALKYNSNSFDLVTRVYPFGKDRLNINLVNNNQLYVEDHSYTTENKMKYLIDDTITVPEELMKQAQEQLAKYSQPVTSYELYTSDIDPNIEIGDTITIYDQIQNIQTEQRVVKLIKYPFEPEKDRLIISNLTPNFAQMYLKGIERKDQQIQYIKDVLAEMN